MGNSDRNMILVELDPFRWKKPKFTANSKQGVTVELKRPDFADLDCPWLAACVMKPCCDLNMRLVA